MSDSARDIDTDTARKRLQARRDELRAEIVGVNDELESTESRQPRNQVEDNGEQGEQRIRDAVRHGESDRDAAELREVDEALTRIELGAYGVCIDCGRDIAPARLQAQPSSLRCIACQEIFERSHETGARMTPP